MMRVLIDTNVLISYLVQPGREGAVIQAALERRFTLLMPQAVLDEVEATVRSKPRLSKRIPLRDLEIFTNRLTQFSEHVTVLNEPFPAVTRDRNDYYLLAYARATKADYLVTGDKDLLTLQGKITALAIVTPTQFADLLGAHDLRQ